MTIATILRSLDEEIAKLQNARDLLAGGFSTPTKQGPRRPKGVPAKKKGTLSAEARAKIAIAQKKRWAKVRRG